MGLSFEIAVKHICNRFPSNIQPKFQIDPKQTKPSGGMQQSSKIVVTPATSGVAKQ